MTTWKSIGEVRLHKDDGSVQLNPLCPLSDREGMGGSRVEPCPSFRWKWFVNISRREECGARWRDARIAHSLFLSDVKLLEVSHVVTSLLGLDLLRGRMEMDRQSLIDVMSCDVILELSV